jgi:hypothetical protein
MPQRKNPRRKRRLSRRFGLPEATFGAAIASAAASAIGFLVMPKQVPSGRDRSGISAASDIPAVSFIVPD